MKTATVFISYKFDDPDAAALFRCVKQIAANLRRIRIADGKSLSKLNGFSGEISTFIKETATCVIALLLRGQHGNANVLYEVGVAVGAAKHIVIVADSLDVVPTMLRHCHIHTFQRTDLDWQASIKIPLEQQLREIFQVPPDDMVEDKLARRYEEELEFFDDVAELQAPIFAIKAGDFSKAEAILHNMLRTSTHKLDVLFLIADTNYLRGVASDDPAERERCFKREVEIARSALDLNSGSILALSALAAGELRLGRFEEARTCLLSILRMADRFSVAHYNLACCAALLREKEEMLIWLRSAIAINSGWRDFAKGDKDFAEYWPDSDWRDLVY